MKRKLLACILAASVMAAMAYGCGGNDSDKSSDNVSDSSSYISVDSGDSSSYISSEDSSDNSSIEDSSSVEKTVYTVTFDSNGGTAVDAQSVTEGGKVQKPVDPEKAPDSFEVTYKFVGWYCGDKLWNFETDVITENTTLTARYEAEKATKPY